MAKPGPKPKSNAQKKRAGNPGKRSLDKAGWCPEVKKPKSPMGLSTASQAIWTETVERLFADGIVSEHDADILEVYCDNLALLRECRAFIEENGITYDSYTKSGHTVKQYPQVGLLKQCQNTHRQLAAELGLTPSSRTRLPDPNQRNLFDVEKENGFAAMSTLKH